MRSTNSRARLQKLLPLLLILVLAVHTGGLWATTRCATDGSARGRATDGGARGC